MTREEAAANPGLVTGTFLFHISSPNNLFDHGATLSVTPDSFFKETSSVSSMFEIFSIASTSIVTVSCFYSNFSFLALV